MNKQQLRNVLPGGIHEKVAGDWAASDDAVLQVGEKGSWQVAVYPTFSEDCDYRLKPKTLRYRVALMANVETFEFATTADDETLLSEQDSFVRWISDWQQVEVPHG